MGSVVLEVRGMFSEPEIKWQINQYLGGEQSFEDLEDWLVEQSRARYLDNPPAIRSIIDEIRYLMFRLIEDQIDESQFKAEVGKFVSPAMYVTFEPITSPLIRSRSASEAQIDWLTPVRI